MAITTIADAITYACQPRDFVKGVGGTMVTGRPHSFWTIGGQPAAGTSSSGLTGEVLSSTSAQVTGQIPYTNALSGNTYVSRFQGQSTVSGTLLLCDRLWQNSAIDATSTSEQTFTSSVQIPARDDTGTTTGEGVYAGVEVLVATTTNTPASMTLKYTNTGGTAGQTATNLITLAPATVGDFFPIGLASGDTGIQKAQSLTIAATAWAAGTLGVVLYRVLARLELTVSNTPNAIDAITGGFNRMYDGSVPFIILIHNTTTSSNVSGQVIWSQH